MFLFLVSFAIYSVAVHATLNKDHGVEFLFPYEDGLTVNYLDTVNITYTSPFPKPLLYTFCRNASDHRDLIRTEFIEAKPFNASHLFTLNYKDVSACYWNLRPNTSTGYGANSFDIRIITDGKSSTTVGLPAGTGAADSQTTSGNVEPTNTPTGNKDSGLSTGAKAGIGIGAAAIAVVAIAALAFFLLKRRKNKNVATLEKASEVPVPVGTHKDQYQYQHLTPEESGYQGGGGGGGKVNELPEAGNPPVYELGSGTRLSEAPGDGARR